MEQPKTIRFIRRKNWVTPVMPNGEPLPYVTNVKIESEVGSYPRITIECVAGEKDESLIEGEFPVYTVTINADPEKIDTSKLIAKFKNFQLIAP